MTETFGARFARLRKAKGLTQEQIAEQVNISYQSVSKWENDITSPDISLLVQLADILGVTLDQLMGKPDTTATTATSAPVDTSKLVLRISIISHGNDKVNVNLPVVFIKMCLEQGGNIPMGGGKLDGIDFAQIMQMVDSGVMGKLVDIESASGDTIVISVE